MALPTVYAVGTATSAVGGAASVPPPAGTVADDILILLVEAANEPLNTITGYTRIGSGAVIQATGLVTDLSAFWKRSAGSEANVSVSSTPQNHLMCRIIGVRGCVTSGSPVNVVNTGLDNTTGTAFSIPGATTTQPDCLVIAALSTGTDVNSTTMATGYTNASLGSITERVDNWTSSGNGGGIAACSGTKATAGAYSATTGSITTGNTKAFMSFALQGVGATAHTVTPTDSAGLTDVRLLTQEKILTDSAGLTDTSTVQPLKLVTATDSTGLTDAGFSFDFQLIPTDSAGLTDTRILARSLVLTDSAGLTDTSTVQAAKLVTQTDSAGLTDTSTIEAGTPVTLTAGTPFEATGSVTSGIVNLPAGLAAGDYTFLFATLNASNGVITGPASWQTAFASAQSTASTSHATAIYYRKWQSGDTDPTVTCTSGRLAVLPVKISGADGTNPIEGTVGSTSQGSATTAVDAPTQISTDSKLLVTAHAGRSATNGVFITWTPDAVMTEVGEAGGQAAAATNASVEVASEIITAGSTTGSRTATASSTATGSRGISMLFKAVSAGGGTTHTVDQTDDAGLTDTSTLARSLAYTDSAGLTDTSTVQAAKLVTQTDSAGLTDTGFSLDVAEVLTDSAGLTDTAALARSLVFTESAGLTDTSTVQAAKLVVQTDNVGLTDTTLIQRSLGFTDTTSLTDTTALALSKTLTDSAGLTDTSTISSGKLLDFTDSTGLTDTRAFSRTNVYTDSAGLTDTTTFSGGTLLELTDNTGLTDAREISQAKVHTDSVGLTDTALVQAGRLIEVTDSAGLTDTQIFSQTKIHTDNAGLTDAAALLITKALTDNAGLTDTSAIGLLREFTQTDNAGLTDTRLITRALELTDTTGLTDSTSFGFTVADIYTDNAGLTDNVLYGGTVFTPYTGGPWTSSMSPRRWGAGIKPRWAASIRG